MGQEIKMYVILYSNCPWLNLGLPEKWKIKNVEKIKIQRKTEKRKKRKKERKKKKYIKSDWETLIIK